MRTYMEFTYLYIENRKKKTTLSSRHACFVITHSSGDFNDKNIHNHRLNTIKAMLLSLRLWLSVKYRRCMKTEWSHS